LEEIPFLVVVGCVLFLEVDVPDQQLVLDKSYMISSFPSECSVLYFLSLFCVETGENLNLKFPFCHGNLKSVFG
jgi:hypothetical protein